MKTCYRCHSIKAVTDFYKGQRKCKSCSAEVARQWYANNREFSKSKTVRWYKANRQKVTARLHGLTLEGYEKLLFKQGGRCANQGCLATEPGGSGSWHIDHDHACCPRSKSCGKCIRGLLCSGCNTGLGMFKDNRNAMLGAVEYLGPRTFEAGVSGGLV